MGFIHDTRSNVFGTETRSESAYLTDISNGTKHLFFSHATETSVRNEIAGILLRQAGEFFGKGDTKSAEKYKDMSEVVKALPVSARTVRSVEATYEWLADLVDFCTTNEQMIGYLDKARQVKFKAVGT